METKASSLWCIATAVVITDKRPSADMLTKVIGRPPVADRPSCVSTLLRFPESGLCWQLSSKLMWTERMFNDFFC